MHELLEIEGLGHAWSGGAAGHPHTDPQGPCATEMILAFFALSPFSDRPEGRART
jgi:poly(3-hydroxybutyrate) depolymerase